MHIDKPHLNRFRTLRPAQPHQSQIPPGLNSHSPNSLPKSNHSNRSLLRQSSQQRVKQLIRQKRMRTISSMQEHKPPSSGLHQQAEFADSKLQRCQQKHHKHKKEKEKSRKMKELIDQFMIKTEKIMEMDAMDLDGGDQIINIEEELQKEESYYEQLRERSKTSASNLVVLYLNRLIKNVKMFYFRLLIQKVRSEEDDYLTSTIPIGPPSGQQRSNRPQRNLLNVQKFFGSQ